MSSTSTIQSIFDLITAPDDIESQRIITWLNTIFPQAMAQSAFHLATRVSKLFEIAIFENQIEVVHLLLQKGIPADIAGDWHTTPLMWANCLGHTQIATLLIEYGADQKATCYSGKTAADFLHRERVQKTPEYQAILTRQAILHEQFQAQHLAFTPQAQKKPQSASSAGCKNQPLRQINNGKGIDEIFKKLKKGSE